MSIQNAPKNKGLQGKIAGLVTTFFILATCLAVGWFGLFPLWQARLSGVKTVGVVKSLSACEGSPDAVLPSIPGVNIVDNVAATIQFTDLREHTHEAENSFCGNYGIGEQVTLWYMPGNPTTIFVEQDTGVLVAFAIFDGMGLLGCLVYVLWLVARFLFGPVARARAGSPP